MNTLQGFREKLVTKHKTQEMNLQTIMNLQYLEQYGKQKGVCPGV